MPEMSKQSKEFNNYRTVTPLFNTYNNKYQISKEDFLLIIKTYFKIMVHNIVNQGKIYKLPHRLGNVGVRKTPVKLRGVFDYNLFKKEGLKVWKKNNHSANYVARVTWDMSYPGFYIGYTAPYHCYRFTGCREFNRYLAKQIKQKNTISKYYDY